MIDKDYRMPETECRVCGTTFDAATNMDINGDEGPPDDGSVSFCINCGAISVFEGEGMRQPTADEFDSILADEGARHGLSVLWSLQEQLDREDIARNN